MSPTGRIIINGTPSNQYVNKLKQQVKIAQIGFEFNGLPLQPLHEKYKSHKFYNSDLESEILPSKMKTTILKSSKGKYGEQYNYLSR